MRGRDSFIAVFPALFLAAAGCRHSAYMEGRGNDLDPAAPTADQARLIFSRPNPLQGDVVLVIADANAQRFVGESEPRSRFAVLVDPGEHLLAAFAADANVEAGMTDPAVDSDLEAAVMAAEIDAGQSRSPTVSLAHLNLLAGKTYYLAVEPHGTMADRWLVPIRRRDPRWADVEEWADAGPARKVDAEAGQAHHGQSPRFLEACARAKKAWERLDANSKAALSMQPDDGK